MVTCSKIFADFPFAHRQHNHDGHCALIHGHNWTFKFTFAANELDANGFVIDFGKLKWLREYLNDLFDHTLVLNESDPYLELLCRNLGATLNYCAGKTTIDQPIQFAKVVTVPNCGAEGLAQYLLEKVGTAVRRSTREREGGEVFVVEVEVFEDSKNSAKVTKDIFDSAE